MIRITHNLDDVVRRLREMSEKARSLSGPHKIAEWLTPAFMAMNTPFPTLEEFFKQSGFEVHTQEEYDHISQDQLDAFVAEQTLFHTWQEMVTAAARNWIVDQIGFSR